jgi:CPA1 family monovalent cation:H+ antiporter
MSTPNIVLMFMVMLLTAILIEPLARRIKLPFSAALVLAGFGIAQLMVSFGIDTGLRWYNFKEIIFYLLIPVLVFESAFKMQFSNLLKNLFPILVLAVPLMLLSAGIIAAFLYYGINHPQGFPWAAALLTGALLSATDPASVLSMLKQYDAPERLSLLLEGESLFNDATAIVFFSLILSFIIAGSSTGSEALELSAVSVKFLIIFFGGLATGAVIGGIAWLIARWLNNPVTTGVITIIIAYSSFTIGEDVLHFSGVMSVLACGIIFGEFMRRSKSVKDAAGQAINEAAGESTEKSIILLWDLMAYIAVAFLFLLAGVTITLDMFTTHWLAIVIGIVAISVARAISIFGSMSLISNLPLGHQGILTLGGIRGTVTLALALSLPVELDYWYSVQSIAYGVVLFTLFIQTPLMPVAIRKLA